MWTRLKFNMGARVFFDTCPMCLPDILKACHPNEAIILVESLQRDLDVLTSSGLPSRDIRRIQMELQFLMIDIEETGSTQNLETSNYEYLVNGLAISMKDKVSLIADSSRVEAPSILEQVKELRADMIDQVRRQRGQVLTESASMHALVDVLRQMEQVECNVKLNLSLVEQDYYEFRDEIQKLSHILEQARRVMCGVPFLSPLSQNVGILNDRYLRLLQDMDRKQTAENDDGESWRQKLEELERQHAAEVEALQSQLDACLNTPVATNVVAVDSVTVQEEGKEQEEIDTSSIIEAEVVSTLPINQRFSTVTAIAQPVTPDQSDMQPSASERTDAASPAENAARDEQISETQMEETVPSSHQHVASVTSQVESDTTSQAVSESDVSINSEANALESICCTENVSTVLSVMKDQPSSAVVQATALEKLGFLTSQNSDGDTHLRLNTVEENRRKVGTVYGIDLILKALKLFRKDRSAQIHGLLAIGNVTMNDYRQRLVANAGGIDAVLQGMRQFPKHGPLHRNGLVALENFASTSNSTNQFMICKSGGTDTIIATMNQFPNDAVIQNTACSTIACLARSSRDIKKELRHKGAVDAVNKAGTVIGDKSDSVVDALHALQKEHFWSKPR